MNNAFAQQEKVLKILSISLGFVFVTAGVGKIFSLHPFISSISQLTHLTVATSQVIGIITIAIEILGGAALILRFKVTLVSLGFFLALAAYIWILTLSIFAGKEVACNCFGIFSLGISNRAEAILDFVILNLLLSLALLSFKRKNPLTRIQVFWLILLGIALLYAQISTAMSLFKTHTVDSRPNLFPAVLYAESHNEDFAVREGRNRLLMLLDFSDFNCPPCFEDFMTLCDSIKKNFPEDGPKRVILMFKEGLVARPGDTLRIDRWIEANDLPFSIVIAPTVLFQNVQFTKSCASVVGPNGNSVYFQVFPMGGDHHQSIVKLLKETP